jgi:leukotriene-A4 hydrolase
MKRPASILLLFFLSLSGACGLSSKQTQPESIKPQASQGSGKDPHSYSNPEQIKVRHLDLDLEVSFKRKVLEGTATLTVERAADYTGASLVLDTQDLKIAQIEAAQGSSSFQPCPFTQGSPDKILGSSLTIQLPPGADRVRIHYASSPTAAALQWLTPTQTAGKKHPFLFSQSEAIYARTWIPLQDTPSVRVTYDAQIRVPRTLKAVMSAQSNFQVDATKLPGNTVGSIPGGLPSLVGPMAQFSFRMTQPIPSYLIALAVGDLVFKPLGERTGVYAEPAMVAKAAKEFEDTEKMLVATEKLYGPYRWGRYDLLVLPPSFPYGGMENPRLTFATPTMIAGDKSLVSLVAHELAHSWSGNLVTNATWSDFWLNEGVTNYVTDRIIEAVYGPDRAGMEEVLERQELLEALKTLPQSDQILHINLAGRNPEEGVTDIPYIKGATFLQHLEKAYGRERFDSFLRGYFDHFAFQSIRTSDFVNYLQEHLVTTEAGSEPKVPIDEWIYKPGIPSSAPQPSSQAFAKVEEQAHKWMDGQFPAAKLDTAGWSYQEWQHFLRSLASPLPQQRMKELDAAFHFSQSGNAEIVEQWLLMAIRNEYAPAYPKLEEFLLSVGRRKFLKPLYTELVKTDAGRQRALGIYRKARPGYHPIAVATIDEILKWNSQAS